MKIIYVIWFILLSTSVMSTSVGVDYFRQANGLFNDENIISAVRYPKSLSDPLFSPLVYDLDLDGYNEIIVQDGTYILILNFSISDGWSTEDSISLGQGKYSTGLYIYDIDGNSYPDVMAVAGNNVFFIEWNSTSNTSYDRTYIGIANTYTSNQFTVNCLTTDWCIVIKARTDASTGNFIQVVNFNKSYSSAETQFVSSTTGTTWFPVSPEFVCGYLDGDSLFDCIVVALNHGIVDSASTYELKFIEANETDLDNDTVWSQVWSKQIAVNTANFGANQTSLSNPAVWNFDPDVSGNEILFAYNLDSDEFRINEYSVETGLKIDQFPTLFQPDGYIISNIVKGDFFANSDENDACVLGYLAGELDLLCASKDRPFGYFESDEFKLNITSAYPITSNYNETMHRTLIHSSDQYQNYIDGEEIDEIISTYGIFKLDFDAIGKGKLVSVFDIPQSNQTVGMFDYLNDGRADLIGLSSGAISYYDDGFSNTPPSMGDIISQPCFRGVIKINQSLSLTWSSIDVNSDTVSHQAILYYGDSNQQNGTIFSKTAGEEVIHQFSLNKTINEGVLRFIINDGENPNVVTDYSFYVASNGLVYTDGYCNIASPSTTTTDESSLSSCTKTSDCSGAEVCNLDTNECELPNTDVETDNDISKSVNQTAKNLGVTGTIIWLVLMAIVAGLLFYIGVENNVPVSGTILITFIIEFIALIVGVKLSFISAGILWTLIVLGVLSGIVFIAGKMFHQGG